MSKDDDHELLYPASTLPDWQEQERMLEAILFSVAEPVTISELRTRIPVDFDIRAAIARLMAFYSDRGVRVVRVGDGWALRTAPEYACLMQKEKRHIRKLSRAALETLAIIAYHQPATRADIEEIRGVSVSPGTIEQLMQLEWVGFGKRKQTPGRPVTFITTRKFLDHFGIESVRDLPGLRELREAGLLDGNENSAGLLESPRVAQE
ncbi:MAG: SMC-Scp complex subunit ScpB [Rhodobacteraceae bacterium]|nr:SMC-Scp complex subunit ScpB [Paracoccaceae bacterium]MCY4195334.1 SMC-Scp complex subunit ScpB [Paracoccaceae bacterium]